MLADVSAAQTLVLGLGNILLTDDGVGVHVLRALCGLQYEGVIDPKIALCDGGTIGLALLSEVETSGALIAIDATEMHAPPGAVRSFVGKEMDAQLAGPKRTAHEVALADLMMAANLAGKAPPRRALMHSQSVRSRRILPSALARPRPSWPRPPARPPAGRSQGFLEICHVPAGVDRPQAFDAAYN